MATINGRWVTDGEWNLVYSTPKATLKAACKGEGLPVSGTGWQLAWRLIDAGISHERVIERYSWRARLTRCEHGNHATECNVGYEEHLYP